MSQENKYCSKCNSAKSGKFCGSCGTELSAMRRCECGYANIWPHEKFCQECGKAAISLELTTVQP
jgi:hypothetical protein